MNLNERLPPQNLEAESATIGCMMQDSAALETCLHMLSEENFYNPEHRLVFRACLDLSQANKPVDLVTVQTLLADRGELERAGGSVALVDHQDHAAAFGHVKSYAESVRDKAKLRELISTCQFIAADAHARPYDTSAVIAEAEEKVFSIIASGPQAFEDMSKVMPRHADEIKNIRDNAHHASMRYGFWALDDHTGGMRPGQLIVFAGRPGSGKTALALNVAANVCEQGKPVGILSLEMQTDELMTRLVCSRGRVDSQRINRGTGSENEYQAYAKASSEVARWPLHICDDGMTTLAKLKSMARSLVRKNKIKLLVVDYLQLVESGQRFDNRAQEVTKITRDLKQLAKALKITIIACSQINRDSVKETQERKPRLSDLRESGSIEQDADAVMMLYVPPDEKKNSMQEYELLTVKQRSGPTDDKPIRFMPEYTLFTEQLEPWTNPRYWKNQLAKQANT